MENMTKTSQGMGLIGWLLVTFLAAGIGSVASSKADAFYQQLIRPAWAPPAWIFGPVWTVIYFLMGIAAWLVWKGQGFRGARIALSLYFVQLAINALWSWLFFVWRLGAMAFIEIIVLWFLTLCTLIAFWRVRLFAGVLFIPYLAWVSFASVLTYIIWKWNPHILF